ncbi:hypothetical protein, partial [Achromobacter xylosoxidans]|uniref:hypothetical protein n=1 Tax=Alcaligenes xylosoxydans xylosoxydans TaxID=85698 RepID=UPI001E58BD41
MDRARFTNLKGASALAGRHIASRIRCADDPAQTTKAPEGAFAIRPRRERAARPAARQASGFGQRDAQHAA